VSQFKRRFPFRKEFSEEDVNLLIQRYHTEAGDIHFGAMNNDVSEVLSPEMPPFPMSPYMNRPDCADWMHGQVDPIEKIQSKVVERRIRLKDMFTDFDPLRKGYCTVGQLKTAITCMGLERDINSEDFTRLVERYTREDGMFHWMAFNRDVDTAFALPGLEKTPTVVSPMPDPTATAAARRNKMIVSDARRSKIEHLEEKIRERIRVRRTYMKPTFMDMDRSHRGLITRSQFARCMNMLQFELDETAVALLASLYCDRGNHNDFNYIDFCKSVDPPNEEQATANAQINAPFQPFIPNQYFDARGKVNKLMNTKTAVVA
jgi:Ca2+-binding EF-hand superfamily protein